MHLPRDPGEWLAMAILMAVVMAVGMLAIHGLRSHLHGSGGHMRPGIVMSVADWVVERLLALGIPVTILGPMMLLTVRGRQSGRPRTVPIDVHDVDGRRYLIATHGVGGWVVNLRAAGEGTLRLGRTRGHAGLLTVHRGPTRPTRRRWLTVTTTAMRPAR